MKKTAKVNLSNTKTCATKPPSHGIEKNKKANRVYMIEIKVYMYVIRGAFFALDVLQSAWLGVAGFLGVAWCGFANKCQATHFLIHKFIYYCISIIYVLAWLGGLVALKKATDQIGFAENGDFSFNI